MMSERSLRRGRIVSSIAATVISLACGTNVFYVYSAWGPQFAEKLKLSATQSNLVGLAGNFGMYATGIPVGIFVDKRGPRPAVIVGSLLLALGYFPLRQAYIRGAGSMFLLCLYSFFTGFGGCAAFAAAVKTSALNWPHHRGTATAFPLAAFGLSAFFFSVFSQFLLRGDPGAFLLLLAGGCFGLTFIGFFFLRILPHNAYSPMAASGGLTRSSSNQLRRTESVESKHTSQIREEIEPDIEVEASAPGMSLETDETSSLMSKGSSSSLTDFIEGQDSVDRNHSHHLDIRGLDMVWKAEFWFSFSLMGILTGVGLMTINNIGNDATALWRAYKPDASPGFIAGRQAMHVSIISIFSFIGRLCSGVGSDVLVKGLHASRTWCLALASTLFTIAQISAISITNPHFLFTVSSLTGLAYGFLFGVFPSIVAETFGIHGMSQNWGVMTMAPVVSGNIFNLFYGVVFDAHSKILDGGERVCDAGLDCYRNAYVVTIVSCVFGLGVSLWSIRHGHVRKLAEVKSEDRQA
ncbi:MAG: hypothetical protein M1818_006242 [Claussenomyces sp. TS43310]|nr:MAG: hypothetical protein M1818_006242 [Claussenomyces sp. TS43310]